MTKQTKPEKSEYQQSILDYNNMITMCAESAKSQAQTMAMQGQCPSFKLCYKTGDLLLVNEWSAIPEGYTDSGKVMPCNVSYSQYAKWIADNSRSLSIF